MAPQQSEVAAIQVLRPEIYEDFKDPKKCLNGELWHAVGDPDSG
jgi:hypothetical protein